MAKSTIDVSVRLSPFWVAVAKALLNAGVSREYLAGMLIRRAIKLRG